MSKTTATMRREIEVLYLCGMSQADLAREFSLHPSTIHQVLLDRGVPRRPRGSGQPRLKKCQRGHDMKVWRRTRYDKARGKDAGYCLKCRLEREGRG